MARNNYTFKRDSAMRGFGETNLKSKLIKVNPKRAKKTHQPGELLDSMVHELQHAKHPKMGERKIQKTTRSVIKKLSPRQKSKIYGKFKK